MAIRKTLSKGVKNVVRIIAFATLLQSVGSSDSKCQTSPPVKQQRLSSFSMSALTPAEQKEYAGFVKEYTNRSPSAKKLLSELAEQGASLILFDEPVDKNGIFWAGRSDENNLEINRLIKQKKLPLENTFFHEGEHVVHLKRAHSHGINAHSFSSLNDVYIYATMLEALAYRKAALCCMEYSPNGMSEQEITQKANDIFTERFLTRTKIEEERRSYEDDAIRMANMETNTLPNQVYFKQSPDWNKIVSLLSRGEVNHISALPQPTLTFLGVCLLREIEKNPEAKKLEDFEVSCILSNKSVLQQDQQAIRIMVSDLLTEAYDVCQTQGKSLSPQLFNSFLYHIGWPTAQQMQKIKEKEVSFKQVRDDNLSKFKVNELFDGAEKILFSPEIKAFNLPDLHKLTKVLHFEKMILLPSQDMKREMKKIKTR